MKDCCGIMGALLGGSDYFAGDKHAYNLQRASEVRNTAEDSMLTAGQQAMV
jgi:hypothetical protein